MADDDDEPVDEPPDDEADEAAEEWAVNEQLFEDEEGDDDESVEQTGEVAGDELAKLWPEDKPSLLCEGDNGKVLVRLNIAR